MSEPTQGETLLASMLQTEALTTAIMDKRGAKINELMAENERLRHLLASLEWASYRVNVKGRFIAMCPCCRCDKSSGHGLNCALAATIAGKGTA